MNTNATGFDQDEYLHLALDAVRRGDHGTALAYLKEGAARCPQDARIAYMLGAEYAQIGLYDRAEAEMRRAFEIDSSLHTACFQLGLLQMTQARMDQAVETWRGLDALADGHALRYFRDGLVALAADRFDDARQRLQAGMAANDFSPELNKDMENLLARLPDAAATENAESEAPATPVWFRDYQQPGRHN
ncbi:MAG: hypothetical protein HYU78_13920 [Rhodocyclales bacterium]|nr:hypothetical protein [Rhodocyclales bacterium]